MTTLVRPLLVAVLCLALARVSAAQPPTDVSPAEMLKRADADGDGTVSREEFIKARTAMLEQRFKQLDTNGDGKLDEKELEAGTEQMRSMLGGGREGPRRPNGPRPQRPDGERPRRPEGGPFSEQAFDRFDGDGDGTLSREEFAEGMARMRESMPRGGPAQGGPAEGFRRPP